MVAITSSVGKALFSVLALGTTQAAAHHWFNWQSFSGCEATGLFVPEDEADLISWVKEQYPKKTMLRPVGNGHGFGNLTTCVNDGETDRDSYILSLVNLKHFEVNGREVTFGAGWDLVDLIPRINDEGLQAANLGSERVQNYIGAATTGTHGTGASHGNIASQIRALRVVDAQGNVHTIDNSDPDLVNAYSIGIGAMGIVVEVTIEAEPRTMLKRTTKVIEVPDNFTQIYERIAEVYKETDQATVFGPSFDWSVEKQELELSKEVVVISWEETNYTGPVTCDDYCANLCGPCNVNMTCYNYANDAVAVPPQGVCNHHFYTEFEHFLPIENLVDAGAAYLELAKSQEKRMIPFQNQDIAKETMREEGYLVNDVTMQTRFVKGDANWLSPVNTDNLPANASGIFFTLEVDWNSWYNNYTKMFFYEDLAKEFIDTLGPQYNVRPHWNKMLWNNETYTDYIYPKAGKWLDIQEKMDPHCQLVNPFLVDTLGIERCRSLFN